MMVDVKSLVTLVMRHLDENEQEVEARVEYGDMGAELRRLAEDLVPEGVRSTLLSARLEDVDCAKSLVKGLPGLLAFRDGVASVPLPEDFLRLVSVKTSAWERAVTAPGAPEKRGEVLRHHARGGSEAGVEIGHTEGGRVLLIYGVEPGDMLQQALYLADPAVVDGYIEIPRLLVQPTVLRIAEMIRAILTD